MEPPDLWLAMGIPGGDWSRPIPDSLPPVRVVQAMVKDTIKRGVLESLPARTKTEVRRGGRGLNDRWFREAWRDLDAGAIQRGARGGW